MDCTGTRKRKLSVTHWGKNVFFFQVMVISDMTSHPGVPMFGTLYIPMACLNE